MNEKPWDLVEESEKEKKERKEWVDKVDGFLGEFCRDQMDSRLEKAIETMVRSGHQLDEMIYPDDEDIDSEYLKKAIVGAGGHYIEIDTAGAYGAKSVFQDLTEIEHLFHDKTQYPFVWDSFGSSAIPGEDGGRILITVPRNPAIDPEETLKEAISKMHKHIREMKIAADVMTS